jgi:magnesium chelatase family protein
MNFFTLESPLSATSRSLLDKIVLSVGLSARGVVRLLRVARTIADLEAADRLSDEHIHEAFSYRVLPKLSP